MFLSQEYFSVKWSLLVEFFSLNYMQPEQVIYVCGTLTYSLIVFIGEENKETS
jgi:hypothetical protein